MTAIILLLGVILFAQAGRSVAQGIQSRPGVFDQARGKTGAGVTARMTVTPSLPSHMAAQNRTTRTPRPTSTPPVIPPPADPTSTNLMILLAAIIVAVILFGIWINRSRAY